MTLLDDPLAPLVDRALGGDRAALEQLCGELQGPIYRLAFRMLGQAADASDATQEILLRVITHLSQFRGESRVLTWAYTVATHHLLRSRRQLGRVRAVEVLEGRIRQGLAITELASLPEGDVEWLGRETCLGCTTAMLACLSLEERLAIVLAELLGADDDLGAHLCEVSPVVYRKRLSRARQKLRPILEDLCGLARSDAPCSGPRQARAKQLAGLLADRPPAPEVARSRRLPVLDGQAMEQARSSFGALRRIGPIFALDPLVAPPEDLWAELRRRLPAVLGAPPA
jgi:RNA polymerase sigma factor (sigma-70 family)